MPPHYRTNVDGIFLCRGIETVKTGAFRGGACEQPNQAAAQATPTFPCNITIKVMVRNFDIWIERDRLVLAAIDRAQRLLDTAGKKQ